MSKSPKGSGALVAELCGITRRQHSRLVKSEVMPGPGRDKKYDLPASIQAYIAYQVGDGGLAAERAKLIAEQREKVRLQNANKRGELIEHEHAQHVIASSSVMIVSLLEALPNRLSPLVDSDVRAIFIRKARDEIDRARSILADRLEELAERGETQKGRELMDIRLREIMAAGLDEDPKPAEKSS